MQPTEHKHKNDEELIAHIKQSLKTHEELYQLGAWEKFSEQQQVKKRPVFWFASLSGVAAVLAICATLIWFNTGNPENEQLAKGKTLKTIQPTKDHQENAEQNLANAQELANEQLAMKEKSDNRLLANANIEKQNLTPQIKAASYQRPVESNVQIAINNEPNSAAVVKPVIPEQVIAMAEEKSKPNTLEFLANESKKDKVNQGKMAMNKKQSKWDLGLMLAPSFGNTRELNMGYGISMSYNFSERLSLTSGIAYNKMNAGKNLPTNIGMSSVIQGNSKSLEMINEEVTGLDIPLELRYHLNKNVYANFGVSGFMVLNQSRSNTFVQEVVIKSTANTSASSSIGSNGAIGTPSSSDVLEAAGPKGQFANAYIVNQRTTERASAAAIEDVNYIGFYNFSFGYTKKVYKNHSLSVEPFVKLPIKVVTQDNLKLVGTGVRLKIGF